MQLSLNTSIEYVKGIGPAKADTLKRELGIYRVINLIQFYPFRYVDRSKFYKLNEISGATAEVQAVGKIIRLEEAGAKGRGKRLVAYFEDSTGSVELVWFRGIESLKRILKIDEPYVLFGKPNFYNNSYSFPHPELELVKDFKAQPTTGLQPIYHSTEKLTRQKLTGKNMGKIMREVLQALGKELPEFHPKQLLLKYGLPSRYGAYAEVHFPKSIERLELAKKRLKFDEFYFLQLNLLRQKLQHQKQYKGYTFEKVGEAFNTFYSSKLPFELTGPQKKVLKEIRKDTAVGEHMNRLLQGDVGSGKTIVALLSMLMAIDNGFQACLMAPTEILATQHFIGLHELLENTGIEVALLTGSTKTAERKALHKKLQEGSLHILIGTHALIEPKVKFKNLGLAVVDEQHRFGVAQRAKLWAKNQLPPHILVMTATPIPRTLAMAVYGDLDVSVIDELPPGRKPINTVHQTDENRLKVFGFIKEQIELGRQVYVVYPLIEESEKMDYKDLMDGYESLTRAFPAPNYQISIVHGKMKPDAKEQEMQRFVKGETQIMVATTVIEVGVNVPNASVMVIESAERFGLSQLHQLRGRVGRGAEKSYCILMSSHKLSNEAKTRLQTMVRTNDGFEIANTDMKLRGPGDIAGTRQSGVLDLKLADIVQDGALLEAAREEAKRLLEDDPELQKPENHALASSLNLINGGKNDWGRIS